MFKLMILGRTQGLLRFQQARIRNRTPFRCARGPESALDALYLLCVLVDYSTAKGVDL
jgi:hypothetical protein